MKIIDFTSISSKIPPKKFPENNRELFPFSSGTFPNPKTTFLYYQAFQRKKVPGNFFLLRGTPVGTGIEAFFIT